MDITAAGARGRRWRIGAAVGVLLLVGLALLGSGRRQALVSTTDGPVLSEDESAASCPLAASRTGLCGTVAGFTGWFGSWTTAGSLGAYCLEHAKAQPRPTASFTRHSGSAGLVTAPTGTRQRLGYLLGRYAGTSDPTTAAALAIVVHAAEGDTLTTDQFSSYPSSLPDAVRARVLALWGEAGRLHGPYAVSLSADGGSVTATVRSVSGAGVAGLAVAWGGARGSSVTGADGTATAATGVAAGSTSPVTMTVGGLAADDFDVWVPVDASVQRVAVPRPDVTATRRLTVTGPPARGTLRLRKATTDAFVGPAGAQFAVVDSGGGAVAVVTSDGAGVLPDVPGLAAGDYSVVEQVPCGGCTRGAPQSAHITPGAVTALTVTDGVVPLPLSLRKQAPDGSPLAGAVLGVRRQSRPGGAFDTDLGSCTTAADGSCQLPGGNALPPGIVQVREEAPAPGTVPDPVGVRTVDLLHGPATVTFTDARLTTAGFLKSVDEADPHVDPAHVSPAGAVFEVVDVGGSGRGRCTTDSRGGCALPAGSLVEGETYRWREVTAPFGLAAAAGDHSFTATVTGCDPGCTGEVIAVSDAGAYARVTVHKHAIGGVAPIAGATIDLCADGALPAQLAATWTAPASTACRSGEQWVGSAVTGADGVADFGLRPSGAGYRARERLAPPGWLLAATPACSALAAPGAGGADGLVLDLADAAVPTAAAPRPLPRRSALAVSIPRPPATPGAVRPSPPAAAAGPPLAFTGVDRLPALLALAAGLILCGAALVVAAASPTGTRRGRELRPSAGSPGS